MLRSVALAAGSLILNTKNLGAVVACAAALTALHLLHGNGNIPDLLLHFEETGMTLCALEAFTGMVLSIEYHLAGALRRVLNGPAERNCEGRDFHGEHESCSKGQYE